MRPRDLIVTALAALILAVPAHAQRGGSSSGGSSGSRSYSSGGGGSSGSRSYSSGGSSSGGKSYSSGGSVSKPAAAGGGSKSYSSGGGSPSGGKSYSSGGSATAPTPKPPQPAFDALAAKDRMRAESRAQYERSQATKAEYKTPTGKTAKIDPKDAKIERLRGQLDQQKWVNRQQRQEQFYGAYYARPVVVFADPYPSYFWWWLLDRSLEERALWAYHHRADMDQARYRELLARDRELEARLRALEAQKVARDPGYVPAALPAPDLMYDNGFVDAVYNPAPPVSSGGGDNGGGGAGAVFRVFLFVFLAALALAFIAWVVYAVFFYKGF